MTYQVKVSPRWSKRLVEVVCLDNYANIIEGKFLADEQGMCLECGHSQSGLFEAWNEPHEERCPGYKPTRAMAIVLAAAKDAILSGVTGSALEGIVQAAGRDASLELGVALEATVEQIKVGGGA